MEYNTSQEKLVLPEYGRNIQRLIEFCKTIENRDERNRFAEYIVFLMGGIANKNHSDQKHKLWYHFAMIANFDIDIDFPIDKPEPQELSAIPEKMPYPQNNISHRYYGRNIEGLIKKIVELPDGEEKNILIKLTANHMKRLYVNWNRPQVNDEVIFSDMRKMSDDKIIIPDDLKLMYVAPQVPQKEHKRSKKKYSKR